MDVIKVKFFIDALFISSFGDFFKIFVALIFFRQMATQPLSRGLKVESFQACFGSSRFVSSGQETEKFCWTILGRMLMGERLL